MGYYNSSEPTKPATSRSLPAPELPLLHAQDPVLAADVDSSTQTQGAVLVRDLWGASRCIHKMSGLNIPGLKHVENIWKLQMSEASSMFLFLVIHAMWVTWFACVDCVIGRFCKPVRGRTNIWAACVSKKVKCVASSVHNGSLTYNVYHSYSRSKINHWLISHCRGPIPVLPSSSVMPNFRQIYWGMPRVPESTRMQMYGLENWGDAQAIRSLTVWLLTGFNLKTNDIYMYVIYIRIL